MNGHIRPSLLLTTLMVVSFSICVTGTPAGAAEISLAPDRTVLSPALLKEPIMVSGSGWKPGEMVVVNLILPQGVTVKGVNPGEDVGIAAGNADEKGTLKTNVGPTAILMTLFQADWDDAAMKPDLSKARPLPPGTYTVRAIGLESDMRAEGSLTLLPPPEKK